MNQSEINVKNLKPILFIVIVLVLTAVSAYPQRKFGGRVIEVIDGKTCVILLPGGKITAVLQYIEIPEAEQPLYQTAREHLRELILDKPVEFSPRIVMKDRTVGQLIVKGVDVSQQMLRDGAAWYSIPEKNGQEESQGWLYQDNEAQAKTEKLGVWGVEYLKPAWEFRAEQVALKKKQEEEAVSYVSSLGDTQVQKKNLTQGKPIPTQTELWADVGGSSYDQPLGFGGLRTGFDPLKRIGHISTPSIFLDFPKNEFSKVESRLYYLFKGDKSRVEDSVYALAILSTSKEYKFMKANNLTITADKQKIALGKPLRFSRKDLSSVRELLVYKITRAQIMKLVQAEKISLQAGRFSGGITVDSLTYINNLINAS
jgi:endonuclease YncB( thermonuclease family)